MRHTIDLAQQATLRTITIDGRRFDLIHCPAGHYLAGAGTRHQARETWLSRVLIDGTSYGQHYATREEAEADNARRTAHNGHLVARKTFVRCTAARSTPIVRRMERIDRFSLAHWRIRP